MGGSVPVVKDGIRLILDADENNDKDIVVVITGAEGIKTDGAGSGSIGMGADGIDCEGTGSGAMEAGTVASEGGAWDGINPIPRVCEGINSVNTGSGTIDADGIRPVTEEVTVSFGYLSRCRTTPTW